MEKHSDTKGQTLINSKRLDTEAVAIWRPRLVIGITVLFTICAIIYAFFIAKPLYEVQAMVQLGKINGGAVEPYDNVREKLIFVNQMNTPGLKRELPRITSATIIGERKDVLLIKTRGRSNKEAIELLRSEIDKLIRRQIKSVDEAKKAYLMTIKTSKKQLKNANSNIKKSQQSVNKIDQEVMKLSKEDLALLGTYFIQLQKLRSNIEKNESWRSTLLWTLEHNRLMMIDTLPPTIVDNKIVSSEKPIKPRKILIAVVGLVSGLLLSLLLVLFLDFLFGIKKRD